MRKRGQGLPLNTIILAIIVVLVLVVVVAFFLGGFKGLTKTVKDVFFGTTAGTDKILAIQICQQRCDQAQVLPEKPEKERENSAFCKAPFKIDDNPRDGDADIHEGKFVEWYCFGGSDQDDKKYLGVVCPEVVCSGQSSQVASLPDLNNENSKGK